MIQRNETLLLDETSIIFGRIKYIVKYNLKVLIYCRFACLALSKTYIFICNES